MSQFLNVRPDKITDHELRIILDEFNKKVGDRNFEFLEEISNKLEFFKKFSKHTRLYLLKLAKI